jgi:hypothetical protein
MNSASPPDLRQIFWSGFAPKCLAMNLAWWSEHPSELPLLTAVVTHLLTSFSQTLTNALYGLFRRLLARPS